MWGYRPEYHSIARARPDISLQMDFMNVTSRTVIPLYEHCLCSGPTSRSTPVIGLLHPFGLIVIFITIMIGRFTVATVIISFAIEIPPGDAVA